MTWKQNEVKNYSLILAGCFSLAIGTIGFLAPNQIATGGTAGLAIVLNHISSIPIGTLLILINIPLLAFSFKVLGKNFALKTITTIASVSIMLDILAEILHFPALSEDTILATLYGGVCVGFGLGLIFKGGGSAGGGTIIAKLITSKWDVKTGQVVLAIDTVVVVLAGFTFQSIELALWSMISIYVASQLIDLVLTGRPTEKVVHISSLKNLSDLGAVIFQDLGVKGTIVNGKDLLGKENKDILFITIDRNRIGALNDMVYQFDERARMVIMEATELLGENKRK